MSDFVTTRWSIVLAAGQPGEARDAALARLCEAYWQPLYLFVRRRGHSPEAAQDLTQEFFARLLEKQWLDGVVPDGGKFRSFLLCAMQRLLIDQHKHTTAEKRGGGVRPLSLDWAAAEGRFRDEPVTDDSPERAYDRRWALEVLHRALERLRADAEASGKAALFEALRPFLSAEPEDGAYDAIGRKLGLSRNGVAAAVKRLRARYREMFRAEVAETLADSSRVDAEIAELLAALRGA